MKVGLRCVKSVQIRSFSAPYFYSAISVFSPNTGKYGPENTPYLDIFHTVSINVFAFRQFYYTYENCTHHELLKRKKLCISILISLLKIMRNILKHYFSGGGVLLSSIMDIKYGTAVEGAYQYRMAVEMRGGAVKTFHFAEVISE